MGARGGGRRWLERLALAAGLLAACAAPPPAPAPEPEPEPQLARGGPFLYRIELEHPSYLFGTIHLPDDRVLALPDAVNRALADTSVLYTEILMDPENMLRAAALASGGPDGEPLSPLRERVPADLYERLEAYLTAHGVSIEAFDRQPLWLISAQIAMIDYLPVLGRKPVLDQYLATRASLEGKELRGLEAPEEQFEAIQSPGQEGNLYLLEATLDALERAQAEGRSLVGEVVDAYLAGDEQALMEALFASVADSGVHGAAFYENVLVARSRVMAERIGLALAEDPARSHFYAIGAGHLPGESGVVALLRARGLELRRIRR